MTRPTPTVVRKITGNPGKRPMNQREPDPVLGLPECPAHLQGEARVEWHRLGRQMVEEGRMGLLYKGLLALYCVAWQRWIAAETEIATGGMIVRSPSGHMVQSPFLPIANRAWTQMMKALSELGISPTRQARASTVQGAATVDSSEDFSEWLQPGKKRKKVSHRFSPRHDEPA